MYAHIILPTQQPNVTLLTHHGGGENNCRGLNIPTFESEAGSEY